MHNCAFHHSPDQAVVLSEVSGDVYINNSQFTHNNNSKGSNGTAIHYSSLSEYHIQLVLVIENCNFTLNGAAESVVYVFAILSYNVVMLRNIMFINNKGVPISVSNSILHLDGNVVFKQNEANAGGCIHSTDSNISFTDGSIVTFEGNSVQNNGGSIFLNGSSVVSFGRHSVVIFTNNFARQNGGAIYFSSNSHVLFSEDSRVAFNDNSADVFGGAVYFDESTVSFDGGTSKTFVNNTAASGEAVYFSGSVLFDGNSSVTFVNNNALRGGAVFGRYSNITFNNMLVTFVENSATISGGAIYAANSDITFNGRNTSILFANNNGGAIFGSGSNITFSGEMSVMFADNTVFRYGGAIYLGSSNLLLMETCQ